MRKVEASEITGKYRQKFNQLKEILDELGIEAIYADTNTIFLRNKGDKEAEAKIRSLYNLKESVEGVFYWLNALHPEMFDNEKDVKKLLEWTPSCFELPKDSKMYEEGDESSPFFSETYLYNLLGKEDARTLLSLLKKVLGVKSLL